MCHAPGHVVLTVMVFAKKCIFCDTFTENLEPEMVKLSRDLGLLYFNKLT